ncbi:hypothetical protein FS837_009763 [Tulasnella sp. UAMH 9824]|nr:hypothetical protein FS837_009763 [Tulasnella sp. UAMH 9824]
MDNQPRQHQEEDPDELEAQHFAHVIRTFREYETYHLSANNRRRKDFHRLTRKNQELLEQVGWKQRLEDVDEKIAANQAFLDMIVDHPDIFSHEDADDDEHDHEPHSGHQHSHGRGGHSSHGSHSHSGHGGHSHSHGEHGDHGHSHGGKSRKKKNKPTDFDMDKLRSTLKQFVRDWSEQGKPERDLCYKPMIDALLEHFSDIPQEERTDQVNQHTLYPFIHSFSNVRSAPSITTPISIPDVQPSDLPQPSDFSLVAGDFIEIYGVTDEDIRSGKVSDGKTSQEAQWNAVLTCFFIDTAKDIVEYLRIIHQALVPGGIWVNLGPLLWHYENNNTGDISIEASLDEVKALATAIGFEISQEKTIPTTYTGILDGMLRYEYQAEFWVATKKAPASA